MRAAHSLFGGVRDHAGRYREQGRGTEYLTFGPHRSSHRDVVKAELEQVLAELRTNIRRCLDAPDAPNYEEACLHVAAKVHADLIKIHPFEDGKRPIYAVVHGERTCDARAASGRDRGAEAGVPLLSQSLLPGARAPTTHRPVPAPVRRKTGSLTIFSPEAGIRQHRARRSGPTRPDDRVRSSSHARCCRFSSHTIRSHGQRQCAPCARRDHRACSRRSAWGCGLLCGRI